MLFLNKMEFKILIVAQILLGIAWSLGFLGGVVAIPSVLLAFYALEQKQKLYAAVNFLIGAASLFLNAY